ncbi:MAG: TauD/TfdA family dioxygenase [Cocleimonas sp.]
MPSPFTLKNSKPYKQWRSHKLEHALDFNASHEKLFIEIEDIHQLRTDDRNKILKRCDTNSMCLYRVKQKKQNNKKSIHFLANQLGLNQLDSNICADSDSLTSITATDHKGQHEYIPYSKKKLSWHTDGYYNHPSQQINSMLLHCNNPAKEGGASYLMDHELAYIALRDENPDFIKGLMQEDALTIPANTSNGKVIREAQSGPVFSINSKGQLHMRFSARKRNIEWKQSTPILEAVEFLEKLLESSTPYIGKYTFKAGEGIICRNILHRRDSFHDCTDKNKKRLLYRGRYYDTLANLT